MARHPLLAIVRYPTVEEAKAHWDQLTEGEKQVVTTRSRWEEEFQASSLKHADQLPELPGSELRLIWDLLKRAIRGTGYGKRQGRLVAR